MLQHVKNRFRLFLLSAVLWTGFSCISIGQVLPPLGLGSTNYNRLWHFRNAVESSATPITVLAFGDSVSQTYRSIQLFLFEALQTRIGSSGYSLLPSGSWWQPGGGTWLTNLTSEWWTLHSIVPPGGSLIFSGNQGGSGSVSCNKLGVFWIAQPDGGNFTLSASTNGGTWSPPLLSLDGFSPTPTGRFQTIELPKELYRIRLDGVNGTNIVLGPQFIDTTVAGLHVAFMAQDGANLNEVFSISTNVLYPIISALNPQLVVWHMKELADLGQTELSNRLYDLGALWKVAVTNGDVLYVGTPYDIHDVTGQFTPTQNELVRAAAIRDNQAYADCMSPCVSYQSMTNNGFLDDTIHPSNKCNSFLANRIWNEAGFFGLRAGRQVSLRTSAGLDTVEWATTPAVNYTLQTTSDWATWSNVVSTVGDGTTHMYTNHTEIGTPLFFRLRLSGN
jgi:hypothetical protein